jgi:hypothetical protein
VTFWIDSADRGVRLALGCVVVVLAPIAAALSVVLFPFLVVAAVCALPLVAMVDATSKFRSRGTLRFVCWAWLVLVVPTFGVMPLLIAGRLHWSVPGGNTLGIFAGFTYSALYDYFIPTPDMWMWDHPFPPVSNTELALVAVLALAVSLLPADILLQLRRGSVLSTDPPN